MKKLLFVLFYCLLGASSIFAQPDPTTNQPGEFDQYTYQYSTPFTSHFCMNWGYENKYNSDFTYFLLLGDWTVGEDNQVNNYIYRRKIIYGFSE